MTGDLHPPSGGKTRYLLLREFIAKKFDQVRKGRDWLRYEG